MKSLVLLLMLGGCASQVIKEPPVIVKVPVNVPCTTPTPVQPVLRYAPGTYTLVFPIVRDLKADRAMMLAYQAELEAALQSCK